MVAKVKDTLMVVRLTNVTILESGNTVTISSGMVISTVWDDGMVAKWKKTHDFFGKFNIL